MGQIGEWLGDVFFGVVNFFEGIRAGKNDDPDFEEVKLRYRQLVAATIILCAIVGVGFLVGDIFDSAEANPYLAALGAYRGTVGLVFAAGSVCIGAFMLFCTGRIWWLHKRNGA